jgi:hypothetical protein
MTQRDALNSDRKKKHKKKTLPRSAVVKEMLAQSLHAPCQVGRDRTPTLQRARAGRSLRDRVTLCCSLLSSCVFTPRTYHTHTHTHTHTYTHTNTHIHTHTDTHIHTYIHTHKHTQANITQTLLSSYVFTPRTYHTYTHKSTGLSNTSTQNIL